MIWKEGFYQVIQVDGDNVTTEKVGGAGPVSTVGKVGPVENGKRACDWRYGL